MAKEHSFDISASIDKQEFKNALETAKKEVLQRYDFKGVLAEFDYNEKDKTLTITSSSDNKIDAMKDVFLSKMIKRGLDIKALVEEKRENASGANVRAIMKINDSISSEDAKKIVKHIKATKLKVNASIKGDEVRVSGKSIDDLRTCMNEVKSLNLELPLTFKNLI